MFFAFAGCGESGGHTHKWSATYNEDGNQHYQTCSGCDEKNYSDHIYKNGKCVCGKDEPKPSEGLRYTLSEDETYYSVSGIGTCTDTEIYIPAEYNGKPVTSIGSWAFLDCTSLTSVTIPNSVTSIGSWAFFRCSSFTSITIPDSVTSIGNYAFSRCSSLTSITIPDSVTRIGDHTFENCNSLTRVCFIGDLNKWVEMDGLDELMSSSSKLYINGKVLTTVELTTATKINSDAFSNCNSLTSITISNSVTSIGACAFYDCSNLTDITFKGTKEEWNAIKKGSNWDKYTGDYTIYCTDGDIQK